MNPKELVEKYKQRLNEANKECLWDIYEFEALVKAYSTGVDDAFSELAKGIQKVFNE